MVPDVHDTTGVAAPPEEGPPLGHEHRVDVCLGGQTLGRGRQARHGVAEAAEVVHAGAVGEGDRIDFVDRDARLPQAEVDRLVGECLRVLVAVEPLLLYEGHGSAVPQQGGRRVVGEAVDAQHRCHVSQPFPYSPVQHRGSLEIL